MKERMKQVLIQLKKVNCDYDQISDVASIIKSITRFGNSNNQG